ncbi:hypothetical protein CRYUN_Cryun19dG0091100 [Craigia yunnanensis]
MPSWCARRRWVGYLASCTVDRRLESRDWREVPAAFSRVFLPDLSPTRCGVGRGSSTSADGDRKSSDQCSIFVAIYKFKSFTSNYNHAAQNAPNYVIAFQGTINKSVTRFCDFKLDLLYICNRLHESSRFQLAVQAVQSIVVVAGTLRIWLAGHSLGSAMSLLAGNNVTKLGYSVDTYLFNPPSFSVPVEIIKNEKLRHRIHFTSSIVKAGLAVAVKGRHQRPQQDDSFILLSAWT